MHCLVTGASGYLGSALVPALSAAGYRVTAQTRRRPPTAGVDHALRCELDAAELHSALQGVDVVLHLAAVAHQRASTQEYRRVNLLGTLALARAAMERGVRRFVFVSSIKAAAHDESGAVDMAAAGELDYSRSKWLAEQQLAGLCRDGDMQLVVLRPALLYGGDLVGNLALLARWAKLRLPAPPDGGGRAMLAREDAARLLVQLCNHPAGPGAPITATDGQRYTARRLHRALCRAAGRRPLLPTPPPALWRLGAGLADLLRGEQAGSTWQRLDGSEAYRASDLQTRLGYTPAMIFEHTLGVQP